MLIANYVKQSPARAPRPRSNTMKAVDSVQLGRPSGVLGAYYGVVAKNAGWRGLLGATVGGLLLARSGNLAAGIAAGAAIGAGLGWYRAHEDHTGTLTVNFDGKVSQRPFLVDPSSALSDAEKAALQGGDREQDIPPVSAAVQSNSYAPATKAGARLRELAEAGRLVQADGTQSLSGHPVAYPVDSETASRLQPNGELYLLSVEEFGKVEHSMSVSAVTSGRRALKAQSHSYLEHQIGYSLKPLANLDELAKATPDGQGLPAEFSGVYLDGSSCSQVVATEEALGRGLVQEKFGSTAHKAEFRWRRQQDPAAGTVQNLPTQDVAPVVLRSLDCRPICGLMGTALGLAVGGALGVDPLGPATLIGGAAGAALGYCLGARWNVADADHTMKVRNEMAQARNARRYRANLEGLE